MGEQCVVGAQLRIAVRARKNYLRQFVCGIDTETTNGCGDLVSGAGIFREAEASDIEGVWAAGTAQTTHLVRSTEWLGHLQGD